MIMSHVTFTGDFEKANSILASFDHRYPGYAVIALRRIGIERRFATKQAGDRLVFRNDTLNFKFYWNLKIVCDFARIFFK